MAPSDGEPMRPDRSIMAQEDGEPNPGDLHATTRGGGSARSPAITTRRLASLPGQKLGTLSVSALEAMAAQPNLQVLDLKDSKIATIQAEVFDAFTHVKVLDVRKNALEELSPAISAMVHLEDLLADQNRLRELPAQLCKLPKLRSISASQNVLKSIPSAIGEMHQLQSLSIGDNHLNQIPTEIGSCRNLQTLYLHHNHFIQLPTSMGQLESLSELALEWFRYTTPPLPRVIKGSEWTRIISKLLLLFQEKAAKGDSSVSCIEVLSDFSQKTFDPNAIDSKRRTRLHVACLEGHVGVAMALAESGSKCDSLDCEGYSPLLVAVREEHPDIATALVRVGVDVNRGGGLFGSPLHVATVNFDPHMVLLLINGKADVNQTDADGNTPLHVLMSVFDKGGKRAGTIGQILLRHGADCNMMNSDKWASLHLAARRGQLRGICFVINHIDSVDKDCLKGTCTHQAKKTRSSRVRACPRAFDLNLRGGSHLWTPMHLAGHACHVPVVQVLIEAGANVFIRNIDGRTARHVSRGNLAISKLLRKAEDEWLWHCTHVGDSENLELHTPAVPDGALLEELQAGESEAVLHDEESLTDIGGAPNGAPRSEQATLEEPRPAKNNAPMSKPKPENAAAPKPRRIQEKCRDAYLSKAEIQQLQTANFAKPAATLDEFIVMFKKVSQHGTKHRLSLMFSKTWAKGFLLAMVDDPGGCDVILQPCLICNEDFVRMFASALPRERLTVLGQMRTSEQESLLHILCKGSGSKPHPPTASKADILSFLLTVCPPESFDLDFQDQRGQTPLHLAVQSGDLSLVQVLLDGCSNPNALEETTGWTPLHFAVAKSHYTLILQLLHHDATNVNQADKFDWPPLLEACSRLDARAASLLANGGANIGFRNQHQFDVLKAVDTSKKDLAAKRWMSCLLVSNGFRFEESTVQLNAEDRQTLDRERSFFEGRSVPSTCPPFFVPDHLAPRCHSCKVLFAVTVRRYHCRSCGLVLCGDCFKWRPTSIVAMDERLRSRQLTAQAPASVPGASRISSDLPLLSALQVSAGGLCSARPTPGPRWQPAVRPGPNGSTAVQEWVEEPQARSADAVSPRSDDSEDPPLAEEMPAIGPPLSVVCPASVSTTELGGSRSPFSRPGPGTRLTQGALSRERGPVGAFPTAARMVRLCSSCAPFFEVGLGETYSMLQRRGA